MRSNEQHNPHGAAFFMEMGTGKTACAISVANIIQDLSEHPIRVLTLCPKAPIGVWMGEIEKYSKTKFQTSNLMSVNRDGFFSRTTPVKRKAEAMQALLEAQDTPLWVVVNYESAKLDPLKKVLLEAKWDLCIADESHKCKTSRTKNGQLLRVLGRSAKYRLALTGTEMPHSPLDVWSQIDFVDPTIFPRESAFKQRYAVYGGYEGRQVIGFQHQEELAEKLNSVSFRARKAELVELPQMTEQILYCGFTGEAKRVHNEIQEAGRAAMAGVDERQRAHLLAKNVLVSMLRAQQLTSGFVLDTEGNTLHPKGSEKWDVCKELILDHGDKPVVVFCQFVEELNMLRRMVESMRPNGTPLRYKEISGRDKSGLNSVGRMAGECDVLGVQILAGGTGIDLTASPIAIFLSKGHRYGDIDQAMSRQHRSGQKNPVTIYHLICEGSIDCLVHDAYLEKADVADWYRNSDTKTWG